MTRPLALALLLATLLAPAAWASPPPAEADADTLWDRVERMEAAIADNEVRARRDIRRGLEKAALHRYEQIITDVHAEITLLDVLYERERDLDRQTEALTRLGTARDRLDRAEDIARVLRTTTRR